MEVFDASIMVEDNAPKVDGPKIVGLDDKVLSSVDADNSVIEVKVTGLGQGYYIPETGKWMSLHYSIGDVILVDTRSVFKAKYKGKEHWRLNASDVLFRVSKGAL
jgi:co-chaperonin GroES (HSP10)